MPEWIYALPDDAIIALFVSTIVLCLLLSQLVVRRLFGIRLAPEHGKEVTDAYRAVISLTALVLAFSLLQAQFNLRRVEGDLRREASLLVQSRNILIARDDVATQALLARLLAYARAVLDEEWPRMLERGRVERIDGLLAELLRAARVADAVSTADLGQLVRDIDEISDLREARITAAALRLPRAFWRTAATLTLIVVIIGGFAPWTVQHRVSVVMLAAALGVLMALVAIVDVPFRGETAVRPTELQRAIQIMLR